jgi:hypothetical protein
MNAHRFALTLALLAVAACRSERAEPRPQTLETTIVGGDSVYLPPGNPQPQPDKDEPVSTTTLTSSDLCSGVVAPKSEAEENACDGSTPLVEKP